MEPNIDRMTRGARAELSDAHRKLEMAVREFCAVAKKHRDDAQQYFSRELTIFALRAGGSARVVEFGKSWAQNMESTAEATT